VVGVYQRQGISSANPRQARRVALGAVLAAGLRNHKSSRYVMKEAIEEAGRAAAQRHGALLTRWHDRHRAAAARPFGTVDRI